MIGSDSSHGSYSTATTTSGEGSSSSSSSSGGGGAHLLALMGDDRLFSLLLTGVGEGVLDWCWLGVVGGSGGGEEEEEAGGGGGTPACLMRDRRSRSRSPLA